jgi:WD40 repeat protein
LRPCSTINTHKKQVNSVLWNANGNWLASGSMDGLIKLYDIRTMKELEVWRGHNSEVSVARKLCGVRENHCVYFEGTCVCLCLPNAWCYWVERVASG